MTPTEFLVPASYVQNSALNVEIHLTFVRDMVYDSAHLEQPAAFRI